MDDAPDIGLIDAHSEGDGGGDDGRLPRHEGFLAGGAGGVAEASVVGTGGEPLALEEGGETLGGFLPGAVNDGGGVGFPGEAFEESLPLVIFPAGGDPQFQVGPVKGELDVILLRDAEVPADVGRYGRGGGGSEGENAGDLQLACEGGQLEVVGPEVVSPLRDAVRFVNGEKRDVRPCQPAAEIFVGEAFRGNVEELESAVEHLVVNHLRFLGGKGGVEPGGSDVPGQQGVDLVLHECNEG